MARKSKQAIKRSEAMKASWRKRKAAKPKLKPVIFEDIKPVRALL